jgi:hypothetical protein
VTEERATSRIKGDQFMKTMLLAILSLTLLAGLAQADIVRDNRTFSGVEYLGPADGPNLQSYYLDNPRTLSADTLYVLRGQVYVTEGSSLTIPAGTLITGEPAGTIVVLQGGQIFIDGTAEEPVVITSSRPVEQRSNGDWGGLVVLGRAPINRDPENTSIEGGIIEGTYGGDIPDDDSGRITYLRLEFPGYRFEEGNEINGLTMGGVGYGTELHHVQVSYANDDSYEWFGGTVDAHHLVAFSGLDDDFDVDDGYTGRLQFLFGLKDPAISDEAGSANGFENDSRNDALPLSRPIYSNVTLVGPERVDALVGNLPAGNTHANMGVLRENTQSSIFNSALVGFVRGWSLRDGSIQQAIDDDLRIRNTSVTTMYAGYDGGAAHDTDRWADIVTWFDTPAYGNEGGTQRMPSSVGLTNMDDLTDPQPQPLLFSELDGTADFSDPYLADVAGRYSFDTTANYRGAFVPDTPMSEQWTAGWTNFDPQNTEYVVVGVEDLGGVPSGVIALTSFPNPFNPMTTLRFNLPRSGSVNLVVYDVSGRAVAELHRGDLPAGNFAIDFDGANLASGTYFARLQGDGFAATRKMQLVK